MLDRYVAGKVNRISPEAPVFIFSTQSCRQVLGGAGNVFSNLISIGVNTTLISVVGNDNYGYQIEKYIKENKNNNIYLFKEKDQQSTVKNKIYC